MGKTYAYNSIIIGFLVGLLVWVSTQKLVLGILAFIGVSIVGFIVIRLIEKAIGKGVDAAADAASRAYEKRRQQKNGENK
ncbi:MAG: hypothetical protein J5772_03815 [Clostridia bacterium]|nr:hypothetical protein [Clostridia bacterium]